MGTAFREFLHEPVRLHNKLTRLEIQIAELESLCSKQTVNYEAVGGFSGGDAKDGALAALADLKIEWANCRRERVRAATALLKFLEQVKAADKVNGHRDATLLRQRHLYELPWNRVYENLEAMGYKCCGLRTVTNWHRRALERAERVWEAECGSE